MSEITLATAIYNVAIRLTKDNGLADNILADVPGFDLVKSADKDALKGIMFYSEGSRKYSDGWYVRRRPRWQDVWLERHGENEPDIANKLSASLLPTREHEDMNIGGYLSNQETTELLRRAAYAMLERRRWSALDTDQASMMHGTWLDIVDYYERELGYRALWLNKAEKLKLDTDRKRTLKKYDGVQPYVKGIYHEGQFAEIDMGAIFNAYYTPSFTDVYIKQPYLDATLAELTPLPAPEHVLAVHMSTWQMIQTFLEFVLQAHNNRDNDEFAFEDALLAIKREVVELNEVSPYMFRRLEYFEDFKLRLARVLGQHSTAEQASDTVIDGHDSE